MDESTQQLQRGLKWFGAASIVIRIVDVASVFVVWKFLSADDIGIAALCSSVIAVADAFTGLGVGYAIVQSPELSQRKFATAYWVAGAAGVALALVITASAPALAAFYGKPSMVALMAVWTLKLVFSGFLVGPMERLQRDLRFPTVSAVSLGGAIASTTARITTAMLGGGAWAFCLGDVARYGYTCLHSTAASRMGSTRSFSRDELPGLLRFGTPLMFSQGIFELYRQADNHVVAALFGTTTAGLYRVAKDLATSPLQAIMLVANRVAFPVFSRHAHSPKILADAFYTMSRYLSTLIGPVTVFLFIAAEDVIAVIAKPEWSAAAPLLRILCVAYFLRVNAQLFAELFRAAGKPRWLLFDSVLSVIMLALSYTVAALWFRQSVGVASICYATAISFPLVLVALIAVGRTRFGIAASDWVRSLLASMPVTLLAGALVWLSMRYGAPLVARGLGLPSSSALRVSLALLAALAAYAVNFRFTRRLRSSVR